VAAAAARLAAECARVSQERTHPLQGTLRSDVQIYEEVRYREEGPSQLERSIALRPSGSVGVERVRSTAPCAFRLTASRG
jgi:hypothetical protein